MPGAARFGNAVRCGSLLADGRIPRVVHELTSSSCLQSVGMDISVRLIELTIMHPRLLWEDIMVATGHARSHRCPITFSLS
jgi:hypothetical protein